MIINRILLGVFLLLIYSFQKQQPTEIRIINNTKFCLEELNVYSQKFKNLRLKDSTNYKSFIFDELTHNSIISLKAEDKYFALYIIQPKFEKNTIFLDSLDIKNRIIYYSIQFE